MGASLTKAKLDELLKALASEPRREILHILGASTAEHGKTCCGPDELCGCKLSDRLGLAPSTISHHMSVLVDAGLVSARPDGKWVYYALCREVLADVAGSIASI
jgi:ArsR family transcriptional regulator, arsenate/arsenite/antimonite-responsive transcriptional repressor